MARLIGVFLVSALATGCCPCNSAKDCTSEQASVCGFDPAKISFTLDESTEHGKKALGKVRGAAAAEAAAGDPDFFLTDCQNQWSTLILGLYCAERVSEYCQQHCSTDTDHTACMGDGRVPIVRDCALEALAPFKAAYPKCAPATLDGTNVLRFAP